MYQEGVRILCLSGGEIALWETNEHSIRELVDVARGIGFLYVALATNGTIPIDYGNADFVLVSIDGSREVHDLVIEARKMGFLIINIVTNGTYPIDVPEAHLILLSLDGDREHHNEIRGDVFDTIQNNVDYATNVDIYLRPSMR